MVGTDVSNFNNIIKNIIEKSLFTERQIEIILNQRDLRRRKFHITKGAYYRQVKQSREKLGGLFYSVAILHGLGVLSDSDIGVMQSLAKQISVINSSDIFPERQEDIIGVVNRLVSQACNV